MSVNATTDYMQHLVSVACEFAQSFDPPPAEPNITDPAAFIADFLRFLATTDTPITRSGTERAADILFTHPDIARLFRNVDAAAALRGAIFTEILPVAHHIFRDHWNYIIGPAMDEHIAVTQLTNP
jgi:hypothetical protein